MRAFMVRYSAVFFLFCLLFGYLIDSHARIDYLELARIIYINQTDVGLTPGVGVDPDLVNIPGVGHDSRVEAPRAQGTLTIESDDNLIIRSMKFEAWNRGAFQPIVDDWVITLDYVPTGGRYEVMSLWSNRMYYITFIRRELPHNGDTSSIIFMVDLGDDSTVLLDYQYPE